MIWHAKARDSCKRINHSDRRNDPTLTVTHLAAVLLIGFLLNLDWNEWFVALLFGIAIDIDHLFAVPGYVDRNGLGAILRPTWDDGSGAVWRSVLHEPMGAFLVIPLAVGWRFMLPLVFWSTHLLIDYAQAATLSHSALVESLFLGTVCACLFGLGYYRWRVSEASTGLVPFLVYIRDSVKRYFAGDSSQGTSGRS